MAKSKSGPDSVIAPVGAFHDPAVTSSAIVTFNLSAIGAGRYISILGQGGNYYCLFTASASAPTYNTSANTDSTDSAYTAVNGEFVNLTPVQYTAGVEYAVQMPAGYVYMHVKAVSDNVAVYVRAS